MSLLNLAVRKIMGKVYHPMVLLIKEGCLGPNNSMTLNTITMKIAVSQGPQLDGK